MSTNRTSYGLNEEEQERLDLVREFAEQKVAPPLGIARGAFEFAVDYAKCI